jgi:hypothetical protein
MSTSAQIAANQKNAQLSTGPTSPDGKSKSSLNAVKTGLTGRTVLLPADDAAAYEAHVSGFFAHHQPAGEEEQRLVQSIADSVWRMMRIPSLEFGIYALGRLEFADAFPNEDPDVRKHLIEAKILLAYQRPLNNLSIQESRLRRQREKDTAALRELQEKRARERSALLNKAATQYIAAVHKGTNHAWKPAENGFEFSIAEVELRALDIVPDLFAQWAEENANAA